VARGPARVEEEGVHRLRVEGVPREEEEDDDEGVPREVEPRMEEEPRVVEEPRVEEDGDDEGVESRHLLHRTTTTSS